MKVVLDTNVVVSALLYGGPPLDALDLAEAGVVQVYTSADALAELHAVLSRPKFRGRLHALGLSAAKLTSLYRRLAEVVAPSDAPGVCSDPQDDAFIGIGLSASADAIISGDRHLLSCSQASPIPIITVTEFLLAVRDLLSDASR